MSSGPVQPIDPCTEAQRLRELIMALASGEGVSAARFGDEEIRYNKADLAILQRQLEYYEKQCVLSQGQTPTPTRYAKRMRFRPY